MGQLHPSRRGWAHDYRTGAAKTPLQDGASALFPLLLRWAPRRPPRKTTTWVVRHYGQTVGRAHGRFATPEGLRLTPHARTRLQRHGKVKGTASPFDGHLVDWARRRQHHPLITRTRGQLLARPPGQWGSCGRSFREEDRSEIDPILPQQLGGRDGLTNRMALHRHCHDQRHTALLAGGMPVKNPTVEELDEEQVLTSSSGGGRAGAIPFA
jgi:RNA-directed DNA polymerase